MALSCLSTQACQKTTSCLLEPHLKGLAFCELSNWDEVAAQFESTKLGDTPLVALTQAKKPAANWPDLPADLADRLEEVWQGIQRDYAAMSSNGQVIVAEDSGHGIQWDQPQLVLDAILAVVKTARK